MRRIAALLACLILPSCAFINIDLGRGAAPFQEQVVEGATGPKVLLLDITGIISERESKGGPLRAGEPSMLSDIRESLRKAEKDRDIRAVIVKINSPGGTVTASDVIYHELLEFKARTRIPVHACIVGVGASGAYYAAMAADRVWAHPTSVTGSIGVITMKFTVEELLRKVGVEEETLKTGDKKDLLSPFRKSTPEERALVQALIDQMHARFVDVVMLGRHGLLTRDEVARLADGRVYSAKQALDAKLIDGIGYLDDVIADIRKASGAGEVRIVRYLRPGGYQGSIYAEAAAQASLADMLAGAITGGGTMQEGTNILYLWR